MSGYPGASYPGARAPGQGGYPGAPPQQGGYPGGAPPQQAGYPAPPGYQGAGPGYQGVGPPPGQNSYSGAPHGGNPGVHPQGHPGAPSSGFPGAPPSGAGYRPQGPGGPTGAPRGSYQGGQAGGPQVDPQIAQWFNAVDQDRSGQIDAKELQRALVNGNWSHFSEEACRMMIDMFDRDKSGQINMQEFASLFAYINQWKTLFESIDRDRSGFIEESELGQALQQMGYRFSPNFVQNVLNKYDGRTRKLTLDNFIVVSVQIKRLTDSFRSRDREMRGQATMQYEDFIGLTLGAHK